MNPDTTTELLALRTANAALLRDLRDLEAARGNATAALSRRIKWLEEAEENVDRLEADLALVRDTLRRRTDSHTALIADRLACPNCSTLPIEETPA